ncbi:acetyl-CoA carboxylase biotin carboxyl carrier protein subunit [candidate division LCP-89 bacterium B3_LCP]|uniref:Acetyl-CoA carboxylase biotin carboxyl carrier protein subunit n=1 Tax=candidate division LCP-89 bacterium B3_LCP TaxID=2012998 RepID=A0A532UVW0_UNCL8|nr:MAG: acetyl-CoA carboxylase biotin carboxyl carrier protein subunit [candidate division LCP-89 bacterium B3_LCP]
MKYFAEIDDLSYQIELKSDNHFSIDGKAHSFDLMRSSKPEQFSLIIDGQSYQVWMEKLNSTSAGSPARVRVHLSGYDFEFTLDDERSKKLREYTSAESSTEDEGRVVAPMPGLVVKLLVELGQKVKKGDGVAIVEAMKMENEIRAPIIGEVREIVVTEKQAVEKGDTLAVIG